MARTFSARLAPLSIFVAVAPLLLAACTTETPRTALDWGVVDTATVRPAPRPERKARVAKATPRRPVVVARDLPSPHTAARPRRVARALVYPDRASGEQSSVAAADALIDSLAGGASMPARKPLQTVSLDPRASAKPVTALYTPTPSVSDGAFAWPLSGRIVLGYGATANGGRNDGINIGTATGTPIHAAADGVVTYAGNELKGYGNLLLIRHEGGYVTAYAHADRLLVTRGDAVKKGQVIGYAGQTGDIDSPQLHFEIRSGVKPVNPLTLLGSPHDRSS